MQLHLALAGGILTQNLHQRQQQTAWKLMRFEPAWNNWNSETLAHWIAAGSSTCFFAFLSCFTLAADHMSKTSGRLWGRAGLPYGTSIAAFCLSQLAHSLFKNTRACDMLTVQRRITAFLFLGSVQKDSLSLCAFLRQVTHEEIPKKRKSDVLFT